MKTLLICLGLVVAASGGLIGGIRGKQHIPGGWRAADENDAEQQENIQEMANFAVQELDAQSNSIYSSKLGAVTQAEIQVKYNKETAKHTPDSLYGVTCWWFRFSLFSKLPACFL